jgi:type II secretion system protein N
MRIVALVVVLACGSSEPAPGVLHGGMETVDDSTVVNLKGTAVEVAEIPMIDRAFGGLPIRGKADIAIDLKSPKKDARQAAGTIDITCRNCTIGGGKLKPSRKSRSSAFAGDGIEVGALAIERLELHVDVSGGQASITRWQFQSPDVEIDITGTVELATRFDSSQLKLCIRYRGTPGLEKRDPKLASLLMITGATRGDDGFYQLGIRGTVDRMRMLPSCN